MPPEPACTQSLAEDAILPRMNRLDPQIRAALLGAFSILVALFILDLVGWRDSDAWDYVIGAVGGAVGGWLGSLIMRKR